MLAKKCDYSFKLVIIGDLGVGKSSLFSRFAHDSFHDWYMSTIGVSRAIKELVLEESFIELEIVDCSGHPNFLNIFVQYIQAADGVMIVFDKTERVSFENTDNLIEWLNFNRSKKALRMMIGNKADMESVISSEEAEDKAKNFGMSYIEASAKNAYQVDLAFMTMVREIVKRKKDLEHFRSQKLLLPVDELCN